MLKVRGLETSYGESQVLFGVDLDIGAGEVVALLGRNGMGKTTTVRSIMGILPLKAGEVHFQDAPIHGLPAFRIARRGLGLVPEGREVFPTLTVRENLIATASNRLGGQRPWTLAAVLDLFPSLAARVESLGVLLSGGEQQMLAIGRALMTNPRLLILDEATEGLAPLIRTEIWKAILRLKAEGQSILVIDKNIEALTRIADRHYVLEKGRTMWSGTSAALIDAPEVRNRYLSLEASTA